ncbi:MAG: hypothetical protein V4717_00750 [Bacteroidota bacterium]
MLDYFLEKTPLNFNKSELNSWELSQITEGMIYKRTDPDFTGFASWLEQVLNSREFLDKANEFIEIQQQLKDEPVGPKRTMLCERVSIIKYGETWNEKANDSDDD